MTRVLLAAILATAVTAATDLASTDSSLAASPPKLGAPAPAFSLPVAANGHGAVTLAALRGRPVFINFFAHWCQPCQDEGPMLCRLSSDLRRRGIAMIGIATLDTASGARAFAKKFKLPYPIVVDTSSAVGAAYGVAQLPVQVFVGADGTVKLWRAEALTSAQTRAALHAAGLAF